MQCSKCEAHIGLLTDNDGEIQYYTNGVAMTFSPKDKQNPSIDVMPTKFLQEYTTNDTDKEVPPKLSMEQMVGMGRDLN